MENNISWLQVITAINFAVHLKKNLSRYNKLLSFVPTAKKTWPPPDALTRAAKQSVIFLEVLSCLGDWQDGLIRKKHLICLRRRFLSKITEKKLLPLIQMEPFKELTGMLSKPWRFILMIQVHGVRMFGGYLEVLMPRAHILKALPVKLN